jgi:predicted hydrocarbon binding protein
MAIDTSKIVNAIMHGSRIREEKGIIPLFGVYLSLISVQYYNKLSFDFEKRTGSPKEAASLLVKAAQECGYATFQGIRNSREWAEVVEPMVEKKEDEIAGFTSVAVAFGWGDLLVKELIPAEKLVLQANDSYEAAGFSKEYGIADSGKCYMLQGVTAAFMDLLYGDEYPNGCFSFSVEEPSCRAKGDPHCEFIARKSSR